MSVLETIIYGILIAIVAGLAFKWFIYDTFIKKDKKNKKDKKVEKQKETENED